MSNLVLFLCLQYNRQTTMMNTVTMIVATADSNDAARTVATEMAGSLLTMFGSRQNK